MRYTLCYERVGSPHLPFRLRFRFGRGSRCCQSNANQSPFFAGQQVLGDKKVAPLAKRDVSHCFEPGSPFDVSLMIEVIVH